MRVKQANDDLKALAVAGSYVVLLGWDFPKSLIEDKGVLGFAVSRFRQRDGEHIWMKGFKTFASVTPSPVPGLPVSSFQHPFQTFQWADYSVAPGEGYTYRIVAMTGNAGDLIPGPEVSLRVVTEPVDRGRHAVMFNRGAIASQEYLRRFGPNMPDQVGPAAYTWLSRGLLEGLEAFIAQAGKGDELLGAFFEFKNKRIYTALLAAYTRGAKVSILYDGDSQAEGNENALASSPISALTKARKRSGGFAHNKFLVFSSGDQARQVWTGSTNLSDNGIFGHSNNAHIIRDSEVAGSYRRYWELLNQDKTLKPTAAGAQALSPLPIQDQAGDTTPVFSPRPSLDALDLYATMAADAGQALFATFAFGMNPRFVNVYARKDQVLRFALMEKKGTGRNFKAQAAEIDRIRRNPGTVIAVGNNITTNAFDRWVAEIDRAVENAHVRFIHTKYMLIDPLGDDPTVIVGSANFSKASTEKNDENMLIIRGNKAVADIYLGEFMRMFSHYAFRESLTFKRDPDDPGPARLVEDPSWINLGGKGGYFEPGSARSLRREYFSGG